MAQKTKVKELVGRGLNSYHTKALQQIDRIEKKNKEQNHKISILSNELDNDYLTKTEEGSVVSLEHSKEGMVYLDELQGNTLVNYCTDGSKELTLNGDIDVEGTFVTITEGADNGKVDVMCEGNTLVNCIKDASIKDVELIAKTNGGFVQSPFYALDKFLFKPNTVYTFVALLKENTINNSVQLCCSHSRTAIKTTTTMKTPLPNTIVFTFTTKEDFTGVDLGLYHQLSGCTSGKLSFTQMILEGDWTNKEIPSYFEGMKSVGQDDENGHKIEILSRNDNLFIPTQYIPNGWSFGNMIVNHTLYRSYWIKCKPNTTYFVESDKSGNRFGVCCSDRIELNGVAFPVTKGEVYGSSDDTDKVQSTIFTTDATAKYLYVYTTNNGVFPTPKIMISEGSSVKTYIEPKLNKKEILTNEPLRGLPSGKKDKIVKIGGKWFIERNVGCKDLVVTGGTNWGTQVAEGMIGFHGILDMGNNYNGSGAVVEVAENIVCDKLPSIRRGQLSETTYDAIIRGNTYVGITVKANKLETQDLDGFKKYINSLNAKFIYNLATPIYEPLEIEPTLNTYNDITHISNNSLIPCNMKIKNSGYNAIIKPNTLYTVALDSNKSGTIGMNLGGAKGTTTNNVLKLTTPATLADDSLRLYGKGIKGSKVRLLEGDKTNWIPSHFEGMKSSFEDKFDATDNTYKMEILSNNRNLLSHEYMLNKENWLHTLNHISIGSGYSDRDKLVLVKNESEIIPNQLYYILNLTNLLKPNTTYTLSFKNIRAIRYDGVEFDVTNTWYNEVVSNSDVFGDKVLSRYVFDRTTDICTITFTTPDTFDRINWKVNFMKDWTENPFKEIRMDYIQLEEGQLTSYEPYKSNKIQFLINEPLRSVPNGKKDKFVFRDGKLMIERNTKSVLFNGSEDWRYRETRTDGYCYTLNISDLKKYGVNSYTQGYVDRFFMRHLLPFGAWFEYLNGKDICLQLPLTLGSADANAIKNWLNVNNVKVVYEIEEPTYEEIPFELQKIILEGYENGTLFFDTNIPPTSTVTYAGETPIVKSVRLNKTEVLNNTEDINDNIIPYLMDMDYRVVMLQLATEELEGGVSMARLFGGTYEMIKRDILSKRLTREEYGYRLADYFNAGKLTEEQVRELEELR